MHDPASDLRVAAGRELRRVHHALQTADGGYRLLGLAAADDLGSICEDGLPSVRTERHQAVNVSHPFSALVWSGTSRDPAP